MKYAEFEKIVEITCAARKMNLHAIGHVGDLSMRLATGYLSSEIRAPLFAVLASQEYEPDERVYRVLATSSQSAPSPFFTDEATLLPRDDGRIDKFSNLHLTEAQRKLALSPEQVVGGLSLQYFEGDLDSLWVNDQRAAMQPDSREVN